MSSRVLYLMVKTKNQFTYKSALEIKFIVDYTFILIFVNRVVTCEIVWIVRISLSVLKKTITILIQLIFLKPKKYLFNVQISKQYSSDFNFFREVSAKCNCNCPSNLGLVHPAGWS